MEGSPTGCGVVTVEVGEERVDVPVPPQVLEAGLVEGDPVELMRTPAADGADGAGPTYSYVTTDRDRTLLWLLAAFLLAVLAIARWRGLFALVGLAFGGAVVWWFLLPALLDGAPGVGVALTSAAAIMFVVLYTTHGFSLRTSTALAGTLVGIGLTALLGVVAVADARLTGMSDDAGGMLRSFAGELDFQSLLGCALVIAGLGVLNDVTITQASAVWELRAASPHAPRREVYAGAMRIGRDHIASTIYTIVFAYVGTALVVLMLLSIYDRPLVDLRSTEQLAEEIVRTLVTSIGLVLAVPITTALAALVAAPSPRREPQADAPRPGRLSRPLSRPLSSPADPDPPLRPLLDVRVPTHHVPVVDVLLPHAPAADVDRDLVAPVERPGRPVGGAGPDAVVAPVAAVGAADREGLHVGAGGDLAGHLGELPAVVELDQAGPARVPHLREQAPVDRTEDDPHLCSRCGPGRAPCSRCRCRGARSTRTAGCGAASGPARSSTGPSAGPPSAGPASRRPPSSGTHGSCRGRPPPPPARGRRASPPSSAGAPAPRTRTSSAGCASRTARSSRSGRRRR
ncbi:YibE/F family protein [Nocardioides sp. TF02-7]|uniref:YibE/F family protein n=1 Tax=Nocardioides sp. TF02-7 TaxID=2917724 RepID=UPI001F06405B|nr:YibE/F family protein [Nocardioides sp. TF02-7]UMG93946.1 YibE/F family protein [Nocardioides sp. TF02-7]